MPSRLLIENHFLVKRVAFIGTRRCDYDTPIGAEVLKHADYAAAKGYELVSGGAKGVDSIAEQAYITREVIGLKPPPQFIFTAQWAMDLYKSDPKTWDYYASIAEDCHQYWEAVKGKGWYVINLMVRNVAIVDTADIVLAWPSPDRKGGTEHGIKVARFLRKPLEVLLCPDKYG